MEEISFSCPSCSVQLKVPASAGGTKGPCPKCGAEITAPDVPRLEPPPASEPSAQPPLNPNPADLPDIFDDFPGFTDLPEDQDTPSTATKSEKPGSFVDDDPLEIPDISGSPEPPPSDSVSSPERSVESKSTTPSSIPARNRGGGSVSFLFLLLSCFLVGMLAFVSGFIFGTRSPLAAPPQAVTSNPSALPEDKSPADGPSEEATADPETEATVETESGNKDTVETAKTTEKEEESKEAPPQASTPGSSLDAFLNAPDWSSRNVWVIDHEGQRDAMQESAKLHGDGPIEVSSKSLFHTDENSSIFLITTPRMPKGFPIALSKVDEQWRVDWKTFNEFHNDLFRHFSDGPNNQRGTFHLMIKPEEAPSENSLFAPFTLNTPMPGRQQTAWVKKGTLAHARLLTIFESRAGYEESDFNELMKQAGPPVVVSLLKGANSKGESFFQIEDVVGIGWAPDIP